MGARACANALQTVFDSFVTVLLGSIIKIISLTTFKVDFLSILCDRTIRLRTCSRLSSNLGNRYFDLIKNSRSFSAQDV